MGILIEIDHRENDSGIKEILRTKGDISVEEKRLPIGDYFINKHIAVERKTTKDFALSIIDGRLFSQASRLKRRAEIPFMIIEGINLFQTGYDIDPQAIKGAIVSLSVSWQIPLIFSKSPQGTAEILTMAGSQDIKYYEEIHKRMGRRPKRIQTRKLYILQGLPGVGPTIAKRMMEHFGSIEKIMNSSEQELGSIEGIGKKKASKIREIVM
ncbi:MAG TPA: ERCC4 domain-containing protein [Candidatus Brocadiaceae bacterium]